MLPQLLLEELAAQGERLLLLLLPQHHADLAQRAVRLRDLQPVPARLVGRLGDDLDDVAF